MKIKVAACQMCSGGTPGQNIEKMVKMAEEAARENPDFIMFPEYAYYFPADFADAQKYMEDRQGRLITTFQELALKYNTNIVPGTFLEKVPGIDKPYNSTVFINRKGEIIGSYRKIHLCVMMNYDESEYVSYGDKLAVVDADFGKVGLMICYDIRFPEHPRSLVLEGADLLVIPFAFALGAILPMRTAHWDTLTKATALQNMTYVIAANQFGSIAKDHLMGLTRVVDPWGSVIAEASAVEGLIYTYLDFEYQKTVRDKVAGLTNRRPELYSSLSLV